MIIIKDLTTLCEYCIQRQKENDKRSITFDEIAKARFEGKASAYRNIAEQIRILLAGEK